MKAEQRNMSKSMTYQDILDSATKIEQKGFIEEGEAADNILRYCPWCGRKLQYVDALQLCNLLFVTCPSSQCRFARLYKQ